MSKLTGKVTTVKATGAGTYEFTVYLEPEPQLQSEKGKEPEASQKNTTAAYMDSFAGKEVELSLPKKAKESKKDA